jgi:hypothetical protein
VTSSTTTQVVSLHVWRVPAARLPQVAWRMAADRGRLRRLPGVRFAKLLGTARGLGTAGGLGTGRGFGPGSADLTRWAALLTWENRAAAEAFEASCPARRWRELADASCRLDLQPLTSRGRWAKREPFTPTPATTDGPVLALTRARLRPTRAVAFWRAQAGPAQALVEAPGLLTAFGIGEAPLGWQGTVSLWRSADDLVEFAYRHPAHRRVVDETPGRRWYAEELFARFAVLSVTGHHEVLGWCAAEEDG